VNPEEEKRKDSGGKDMQKKEGFKSSMKKSEWVMEYQVIVTMTVGR